MANLPNPDEPEFSIPLTPEQLAELGRLAATWSQIDYLIAMAVAVATKTDLDSTFLFCEGMMMGARVNLLRKITDKMPTDETKAMTKSLCDRLGKLVDRRNHILHGLWGWHQDRSNVHAACYNGRNPKSPVYAAELPDLRKRASNETRQLGLLLRKLAPQFFDSGEPPRRFFFGEDAPPGSQGEPPAQS